MKQTSRLCAVVVIGVLLALSNSEAALAIGQVPDAKAAAVVAGGQRYLVKYRADSIERGDVNAVAVGLRSAMARAGLDRAAVARSGAPARKAASASLLHRSASPGWHVVRMDRVLDSRESVDFIRELKANPAVESVEQDHLMQLETVGEDQVMVPNDPDYAQYQWNFFSEIAGVRAPQAWKLSQGDGVVVAVVDTGIVKGSPDLVEVLPGYDMMTDMEMSRRASNARVPGGWDLGDWRPGGENCNRFGEDVFPLPSVSSWHGNHVAGTIGQLSNNGSWLAGLAYKAMVLPVRVAGMCGGYTSDVADGIVWAAGGSVPGLPLNKNPADVINVSMGSTKDIPCPAFLQSALDIAAALGSIVVVSGGNASIPTARRPYGNCRNVIAVGAINRGGAMSDFSNHGSAVSLVAPGGQLVGSDVNDTVWQVINAGTNGPVAGQWKLGGKRGTSMAAPHVSAAIAMIQSAVMTPYTPAQMLKLLQETSRPIPVPPIAERRPSAGVLNIEAALLKAIEGCDGCGSVPIALNNKVTLNNIAGEQGQSRYYQFVAEAGKVLSFMTYGGSGDVSLEVRGPGALFGHGDDTRSVRAGNIETVRYVTPVAGTYLIRLVGEQAYAGVTLVARQ